jgi:carbon-monoxide dehydrogenase medium subunit
VTELATIETGNGTASVGAMVRHRTVERSADIRTALPLVAAAMPLIGHSAIRSRGTVGGSIAHAVPAAELPAVALALDATMTARSAARGERTIAAADFFDGYFTTALEADEVLCTLHFPVQASGTGVGVEEVARRHGDFAMVGAVAALTLNNGTVADARIAMINVAEKPVRATEAEGALTGGGTFEDAAQLATRDLEPSGDLHASPAYRKKVAAVCVRRALESAHRRATGS